MRTHLFYEKDFFGSIKGGQLQTNLRNIISKKESLFLYALLNIINRQSYWTIALFNKFMNHKHDGNNKENNLHIQSMRTIFIFLVYNLNNMLNRCDKMPLIPTDLFLLGKSITCIFMRA